MDGGVLPNQNEYESLLHGEKIVSKADTEFIKQIEKSIREKKDNFLKNNPYFDCKDPLLQDIKFLLEILKLTKEV